MAAKRHNSRRASRTTGNARSGAKKGKTKPRLTTVRRKKKLRREVMTGEERKTLKMLEVRKFKTDHPEEVLAAVRPDVSINGPFWSSGYRAFRIEYSERTPDGGWWQSSFYCSDGEMAVRLGDRARKVKSREEWLELRTEARKIASTNGDAVLYRTMLGEPSETFR